MEYDLNKQVRILEFDKITALLAEKCSSTKARELAVGLLPDGDFESCCLLLQQTEAARKMAAEFGSPSFYGLSVRSDLLLRAAAGGTLAIPELLILAAAMRVVRVLASYRRGCGPTYTSILDSLFSLLGSYKSIEDEIENAIANEEMLADSASAELAQIRRKKRMAQDSARSRMNAIVASANNSKYLQEASIMMRDGRFVVPVRAECRANVPGLVHGVSASGATLFIEPTSVVEANNEVRILESKEAAEVERILSRLSGRCGEISDVLIANCTTAVQLELIFAKAALGAAMNGCVPLYADDGVIDIKKARHPLIAPQKIVPVDIRLGESFDALVITGPNTGGKTVVLKTAGLFCMMAACGLMIPAAEESRISWYSRILADIGDEQSIEQSLSTFSAHTTNIVSILQHADERSLVLLDELGAGTDPAEGAALAISIIEYLREGGVKLIATTHYAELKVYALTTPRVVNGSCEFDVATLRPTYRLIIGLPGSSNAFAISERLGIPEAIIAQARERMDNKTIQLDEVMRTLDSERQAMEKDRDAARQLLYDAQKAKSDNEKAMIRERQQTARDAEKQRVEQMRLLQHLRFEADRLNAEIDRIRKEAKNDPETMAKRARTEVAAKLREIEQIADPVEKPKIDRNYVLPRPLKVGDEVYLVDMDKVAAITETADKSGKLTVDIGIGKVKVAQDRVQLFEGKKKSRKTEADGGVHFTAARSDRPVETSVMIRHMEVPEAMSVVEQFLDDCVMNNLKTVTIIHGKGTGTLRRAVHELLRSHPNVASYRLGKYGEGEEGVTVVELK